MNKGLGFVKLNNRTWNEQTSPIKMLLYKP